MDLAYLSTPPTVRPASLGSKSLNARPTSTTAIRLEAGKIATNSSAAVRDGAFFGVARVLTVPVVEAGARPCPADCAFDPTTDERIKLKISATLKKIRIKSLQIAQD